ncbi:hypothetical protein [Stappia stellulata]|uniref:hypothetical protein n=1 Tax=Stappia stellulata TaxID=71235 RepID=UPI00055C42F5|nr:hypothetical protein [Stappia stellulata]
MAILQTVFQPVRVTVSPSGEVVPQGARTKTEEDARMLHSSRAKAGKIDLIAAVMLFANAVLIVAVG